MTQLASTLAAALDMRPEYRPAATVMFERIDAAIGEWTSSRAEKAQMQVEVAIRLTMRRWQCSRETAVEILAHVAKEGE